MTIEKRQSTGAVRNLAAEGAVYGKGPDSQRWNAPHPEVRVFQHSHCTKGVLVSTVVPPLRLGPEDFVDDAIR